MKNTVKTYSAANIFQAKYLVLLFNMVGGEGSSKLLEKTTLSYPSEYENILKSYLNRVRG